MPTFLFTGQRLAKQQTIGRPKQQQPEMLHPYLPDADLVQAVNVALFLKRPLLLMGEPGSGKSQLARVLAHELYNRANPTRTANDNEGYVQVEDGPKLALEQDYRQFYEEWNINSNARAREGLYEYDAIQRLGEAQLLTRFGDQTVLDKKKYITDGPMGRAIRQSTEEHRVVLLIDEIDKADLDFSNDLLNELDRSSFTVVETGEVVRAKASPIVVITSNKEKELPDAFLRRCVFHQINPFGEEKLKDIVRRRFYASSLTKTNGQAEKTLTDEDQEKLVADATARFVRVRDSINNARASTGSKSVSTAEFLDWFGVLKQYREPRILKAGEPEMSAGERDMVKEAAKLEKEFPAVPFRQALLKHASMLKLFPEAAETTPNEAADAIPK